MKGLTLQGFNLFDKVRQVDEIMTADLQFRVREGHPEVSFRELAGHPMGHRKTRAAGRLERSQALGLGIRGVGVDDLLDACVMLWTAMRVMNRSARRIGSSTRDPHGLKMTIWA